jgi:hypothetical protein
VVLALELVIEDDALDVGAAFNQPRLGLFVRAIDLEVVFEFAGTHKAGVEPLMVLLVAVSMALEETAPLFREGHCRIAVAWHAGGFDQPLFTQVPEVAGARISAAAVVVAKITTGDHPERANGCERSRLGAAQGVLAITVANHLALRPTRQVHVARERVPGLPIAFTTGAIAVGPTRMAVAVSPVLI